MAEQTVHQDPPNPFYETEFSTYSLGTEEELTDGPGVIISAVVAGVDPKVFAIVRNTEDGKVLLELTKDLPRGRGGNIIELRTTPTEITDENGWYARKRARDLAINAINDLKLHTELRNGLQIEVLNPNYAFVNTGRVSGDKIRATGKQATIGIPFTEIGANAVLDFESGELHQYLKLPWYRQEFANHSDIPNTFSPTEKVHAAIVLSAALRTAHILDSYNSVGSASAKDAWDVRPRTPPINLFPIGSEERLQVMGLLVGLQPLTCRQDPTPPSSDNWTMALHFVVRGLPLGGTDLPDNEVGNLPAILFEYRSPASIPAAFDMAFWKAAY